MATKEMIAALDEEIGRLQMARGLLAGESAEEVGKRGKTAAKKASGEPGAKRVMSEDARERIAAAQRKRWAATKKAAKKSSKS